MIWKGPAMGGPSDWSTVVDVVIAVRDVSAGTVTVLDSHSDNKPNANNVEEFRTYAISELNVQLDAFDQIIISARARSDSDADSLYISLSDVPGGGLDPLEIEFNGPTCPWDINGDGLINNVDVSGVLGAWGVCP